MKHVTLIALSLLLTACVKSPSDNYVDPRSSSKALELCAPYGGLDKAGTDTYDTQIKITAYCKDGTFIQHRIARE